MNNHHYDAAQIERSAQAYWTEQQSFRVREDINKEKFYCLAMFPYPSGTLHMGHVRNYTLADVVARYQRLLGKNVLQPIGWDAFGLPAENAAHKHRTHPAQWTDTNIAQMRHQFVRLGYAYDWRRELKTCDPDYYRWQQWFFLQLYHQGFVYKKMSRVNWDPVDKTVLANEQVIDGKGWRSGAVVEQRDIPQWFLKITAFADELLDDLEELADWPRQVLAMQEHWIGRSDGSEVYFLAHHGGTSSRLKVFTTRLDTIMGASYIAIGFDHPLAKQLATDDMAIQIFVRRCQQIRVAEADLELAEKIGIDSKVVAQHPLTGQMIPVWITNYVLANYGTGAVMGVPAHDRRDFEFARKYDLPIKPVIKPDQGTHDFSQGPYLGDGHLDDDGPFHERPNREAARAMAKFLMDKRLGRTRTCYRLRDWSISRQRYWGTPIPMIACEQCGDVPVNTHDLPILLPQIDMDEQRVASLTRNTDFLYCQCPQCGQDACRETDTFDTFVDSSWYFARFACYDQSTAMLDDRANYWLPVDYYIGGIEHAVLHLLYARFFHKLMKEHGLVNSAEPFKKLLTLGMVLNQGQKMSKSKGNVVAPEPLVEQYGADTVRLFTIFAAPPEQSLEWSQSGIDGAHRFLKKLWQFGVSSGLEDLFAEEKNKLKTVVDWDAATDAQKASRRDIHTILKQVSRDYQRSQFNTVVSGCMKLFNIISQINRQDVSEHIGRHIVYEGYHILLRLLSPIVPHITHHLWLALGHDTPIIDAPWPKVDTHALKIRSVDYVVQINGRVRGRMTLPAHSSDQLIEQSAKEQAFVKEHTDKMVFAKAIVIAQRHLVNLVYK